MTKRETWIGVAGFAAAVLLAGGGYFLFGHHDVKKNVRAAQTVGNHQISLSDLPQSGSGGLSVTSGGTGQLNGNTSQNGSSQGQGANSGSSSSNGGIDTSTFKQYDKYKDGNSGLFAEVQQGSGASLDAGKTANVIYKGWLTDGTLFDESRTGSDGKLQAFSFVEGQHQVIPGWEEAMSGMKAGGTRLLIIPPAVGYGAQGQGSIPPNAVLVFLVQLVDVK